MIDGLNIVASCEDFVWATPPEIGKIKLFSNTVHATHSHDMTRKDSPLIQGLVRDAKKVLEHHKILSCNILFFELFCDFQGLNAEGKKEFGVGWRAYVKVKEETGDGSANKEG